MPRLLGLLIVLAVALAMPASALAHPERVSYYPNFDPVSKQFLPRGTPAQRPTYRTTGAAHVVCKPDSGDRIRAAFAADPAKLAERLAELALCKYQHIQQAVDAAGNGDRILVMPGVYSEEPSRAAAPPGCEEVYAKDPLTTPLSYEEQAKCPHAQNLVAVLGDDPGDPDRKCDRKCNLQIEGRGAKPDDVYVNGDRTKSNVFRFDRADGVYLTNLKVEFSDFNNVYAIETNGFAFVDVISGWSREYGFLTFTSDWGLYRNLEAYGSGDSGVYPGAGPEVHDMNGDCPKDPSYYGIEIDNVDSYHNNMGYSGTAGNGVWAHDSKFHDNAAGLVTDSFVPNHPGMPQDCARWERNQFYSNNFNLFNNPECDKPPKERDPHTVCSSFGVPVGTGLLIAGGNKNLIKDNYIYDNWRTGTWLIWVPPAIRTRPDDPLGPTDPTGQSEEAGANQFQVSNFNRYEGNRMGVRPDGKADANGVDHKWDEEGQGNCWKGNTGPNGNPPTHDVLIGLPKCDDPLDPRNQFAFPGVATKQIFNVPCGIWDPSEPAPPGCDWDQTPPEPPNDKNGGDEPGAGDGPGSGVATPPGAAEGFIAPRESGAGAPVTGGNRSRRRGTAARVTNRGSARISRRGALVLSVRAPAAGLLRATAGVEVPTRAKVGGRVTARREARLARTLSFRSATRRVTSAGSVRVVLRLGPAARKMVRRALAQRVALRARVTLTFVERSGASAISRKVLKVRR